MRKRIILSILLCLAVMGIVGCSSAWYHRDQDVVDYCSKINTLIKDQNFRFAELADGKVILQDENRATLSEVAFDEYDSSIRFLSIWQETPVIYFVVQGAVDDERGYLFVNGDENKILDGLWEVERVGRNGYAYSTSP